jgi:hypothetical protein
MTRLICFALLSALVAGCHDDPVSYSDPVGIHLAVSDGDVTDTTAYDEKNINTESGNPYGVFASAAHDAVGGEPSRIVVEGTTIEIADGSDLPDVDAVFDGPIAIAFVMNGSDASYDVAGGTIIAGAGPGPVELDVHFDSDDLADTDYPDLTAGSFKVTLAGEVADGFVAQGGTADFEVVFTFTAYE